MEYNTKRGDMQYREYGRMVKKIIDQVCDVEEGEPRNEATRALVAVMGQVSGLSLRDEVSLHKLWDHLMILSEFRLASAWPYSQEELESLRQRASEETNAPQERLPYKNTQINRRHYGAYLESMMRQLKQTPDGEEYDVLASLVAQQAKRAYLVWNGDLSDDNIIVNQMAQTSGDERLTERLIDKEIYVNSASLPVEPVAGKKKKKKKRND